MPLPGRFRGLRRTPAALGILLFGCAGLRAPVADPPLDLAPPTWATAPAVPDDWWTTFSDPALDETVERALGHSLTLAQAAARLAQAAEEAGFASAALVPRVGVGALRTQERRNFIGLPIPGFPEDAVLTADFVAYGLSLDVSWEANLWREAAPGVRAANALFEAAVAEVAGARVSLAGQAVRLYFLAVEAREQARIAEALAGSLGATLGRLQAEARTGAASLTEVRAAEARLAESEAAAAAARMARGSAVRGLEVLFSDYPDGEPGPDWRLGETLPDPPGPAPEGAPADLIARRPDVAAAERRLAASAEFTAIARRARYPQIPLTASGGTAAAGLRDLVNGDFSVWSLIAGVAAPVFQGGRIRARIRQEEARDREALAAYAAAALGAYEEVESALAADAALRDTVSRSAAALAASRDVLSRTRARRRAGLASRLALLESGRAVLAAESAHLSWSRALLDNRVNLFLALGGGFERALPEEPAIPAAPTESAKGTH